VYYRKKPVIVRAFQFAKECGVGDFPFWIQERDTVHLYWNTVSLLVGRVYIQTLEGSMEALPGDWIIEGVQGEIYPCKPDIFAATYEKMDQAA